MGKTWLMKEFGREYYKDVVYISFDNNERMKQVFSLDMDIERIINALQIEAGKTIHPKDMLLIFDEIQEVPKALTSLKYFFENAPEYHIVAAGSLLGVALHGGTSFPVGKVEFLTLYPLTFEEYLRGIGQEGLAELLKSEDYPTINAFGSKLKDLLRYYYYIGGMPEVVQTWKADGMAIHSHAAC